MVIFVQALAEEHFLNSFHTRFHWMIVCTVSVFLLNI